MPSPVDPPKPQDADLRDRINRETGRIQWTGLQGHFARGVVMRVDPGLDLVEVAVAFHRDDRDQVEAWTRSGQLARASDDDARGWNDENNEFWAVVVAPWVLVQANISPSG